MPDQAAGTATFRLAPKGPPKTYVSARLVLRNIFTFNIKKKRSHCQSGKNKAHERD
jgi:hypothetical protein